jgi:hypothetical protein
MNGQCVYIFFFFFYNRSGIHETGTLVGCLRKLEGWNFSSIVTEVEITSTRSLFDIMLIMSRF